MILLESFRLALDAIFANKMRSILTVLGVVIGVSAVILLVSVGQGVRNSVTEQIRGMGSNLIIVVPGAADVNSRPQAGFSNKLRVEHIHRIERESIYVRRASSSIQSNGTVKFGNKVRRPTIYGVTEGFAPMMGYTVAEGAFISDHHVSGGKRVAAIGKTVVDNLFPGSNPIGRRIRVEGQSFTIIGIIDSKGKSMGADQDDIVLIPISIAQRLFGIDWVSNILIEAIDDKSVDMAVDEVNRILAKSIDDDEFTVTTQEKMLGMLEEVFGTLTLMLGGIAGISLLVGGIGIMNIMLVSVTERTREIGIRKSIGAKTHDIMIQFVIEATTLSIIGGLIGIVTGVIGSMLLKMAMPSEVTPWSILIAFVFSAGVGVFFGAYPSYKASRLSPIEALRYE